MSVAKCDNQVIRLLRYWVVKHGHIQHILTYMIALSDFRDMALTNPSKICPEDVRLLGFETELFRFWNFSCLGFRPTVVEQGGCRCTLDSCDLASVFSGAASQASAWHSAQEPRGFTRIWVLELHFLFVALQGCLR